MKDLLSYIDATALYVDTPGAATVLSAALDISDAEYTTWFIAVGANDEDVTAKVTECATSGGTYTDITGAVPALINTGTASRLYACKVKNTKQYQKMSITSTATAGVEYMILPVKHFLRTVPDQTAS